MTSSWISNFAGVNHTYLPTEENTIDDIFKKKEEDTNVIKMVELKELLLEIIQGKEEIDFTEEELKEIQIESMEDMNTIVDKIKGFIQEFIQLQNGLNQMNDKYQSEVKILKDNISTIENMIVFLKKLPENHKNETIMKSIIDSMNQLSKKILSNEKIKEIKKDYVQKRKEIETNAAAQATRPRRIQARRGLKVRCQIFEEMKNRRLR